MRPEGIPHTDTDDGMLRYMTLLCATSVRNAMEADFHAAPNTLIPDERMPEFNRLVRNAIYSALYAWRYSGETQSATDWVLGALMCAPDYWEPAELNPALKDDGGGV